MLSSIKKYQQKKGGAIDGEKDRPACHPGGNSGGGVLGRRRQLLELHVSVPRPCVLRDRDVATSGPKSAGQGLSKLLLAA